VWMSICFFIVIDHDKKFEGAKIIYLKFIYLIIVTDIVRSRKFIKINN